MARKKAAQPTDGYGAEVPFRVYFIRPEGVGTGPRKTFTLGASKKSQAPKGALLVPVGPYAGQIGACSRLTLRIFDTRLEAAAFELGCTSIGGEHVGAMAAPSAEGECWGVLVEEFDVPSPSLEIFDKRSRGRGPQGSGRAPLPPMEFIEDPHAVGGRAGRPKTVEGTMRLGKELLQFRAVAAKGGAELPGLEGTYEITVRR